MSADVTAPLRPTAFRGDADIDELHSFFLPGRHYAGDVRWTFGTSLKSAYVNSFEFMNHAPVVQLWRDEAGSVQAVSRVSLGTGEWFHLADPSYRTAETTQLLIEQADAALMLLSDHESWSTVRYESKTEEIRQLELAGYEQADAAEVFMTMSLDRSIAPVSCPDGIRVELLDPSDAGRMKERALAQIDAFSDGEPDASGEAWISRSLPHQLSYGRPDLQASVIAVDSTDRVVAFADPFYDRENRIGEFEPVGTRTSSQRMGLSNVVMTRALIDMQNNGLDQAIVRTGTDNTAAIAAYEAVGFETVDHLLRFTRTRAR